MKENFYSLLLLNNIPQRWCHSVQIQQKIANSITRVELTKNNNDQDWSYSACVAKYERYFSYARTSEKIRVILNNTLDILHSVEHEAGIDTGEILRGQ